MKKEIDLQEKNMEENALQKELEQVKAQLKAKEKEVATLKSKGAPKKTAVKKSNEKKVKVQLFYDGNQYKDPIFVSINGESLLIPRGVEVEIPAYFKEVVDRSIAQEQKTSTFYQNLERNTAQNMNGMGQTLVDIRP